MNAVVTQPAFAELIPAAKPTLRELALLAIHASKAASEHLAKADRNWTAADERAQDRLDNTAHETKQAMLAAFAQAGFDQKLLVEIGDVAL